MSPLHYPRVPILEFFKDGNTGVLKGKSNSRGQELNMCLAFEQVADIGHTPALLSPAGHTLQVAQITG